HAHRRKPEHVDLVARLQSVRLRRLHPQAPLLVAYPKDGSTLMMRNRAADVHAVTPFSGELVKLQQTGNRSRLLAEGVARRFPQDLHRDSSRDLDERTDELAVAVVE